MVKLHFIIKGLTPLLMHNPASMGRGDTKVGRKTIPSIEESAASSRYLLPDGNFYVPAVAVRASILNGAKFMKIGKFSARSLLAGGITLSDESFPLLRDGNPIFGDNYSIDTRRAVIQKSGILASRAKIELPWGVECCFNFDEQTASILDLTAIINRAGQVAGLLDFRPERMGWFGKYAVGDIWMD